MTHGFQSSNLTAGALGAVGPTLFCWTHHLGAPQLDRGWQLRLLVVDCRCLAVGRKHVDGRGRHLGGHPEGSSFVVGPSERAPRRHCGALLLRIRAKETTTRTLATRSYWYLIPKRYPNVTRRYYYTLLVVT